MRKHATISLISILASVSAFALGGIASATEQPAAAMVTAKAASQAAQKKSANSGAEKVAANDAAEKKDAVKPAAAPGAAAPKPTGASDASKTDVISAEDDSVVQTITVTARRRKEMLKDIPGSTQVITGEETEKLGINSTRDLLEQIPGAQVGLSGADYADDIEMRGQGSGRNNLPVGSVSETSTALYQDGAYIAGGNINGRALSEMSFFDLQRLEILSGPQGALYGRNAVGGAINVVTHKPDTSFNAKEKFTYGSYGVYNGDFTASIPLSEEYGLSSRLGYFTHNQESGSIKSLQTGDDLDWKRSWGSRGGLQYAPNDEFKIYGAVEYYHQNSPAYAQYGYEPGLDTPGGGRDPYVRNNMNSEGRTIGHQFDTYLGADKSTSFADFSLKLNSKNSSGDMRDNDYDHFVSIPLGQSISTSAAYFSSFPIVYNGATLDQRQSVAEDFAARDLEFTMASNSDGRLKWLLGAERTTNSDFQHTMFGECPIAGTYGATSNTVTTPSANPMSASVLNATEGCSPGYQGSTSSAVLSGRGAELALLRSLMIDQQNTERLGSYAIFGSTSFDLTKRLTAGFEYRFQEDMKDVDYQKYNVDPNTYYGSSTAATNAQLLTNTGLVYVPVGYTFYCPPYLTGCGYASPSGPSLHGTLVSTPLRVHEDARWRVMLPAFTLEYKIDPQNQIYYRWATGYRPGGFNSPSITALTVPGIYQPERSAAHEIGWKGRVFRHFDMSLATFYQTTRDVQVIEYNSGTYFLENAGNAYSYGVESNINTRFKVGRGLLLTSLGLSSNYGRYYDSLPLITATGTYNINGNRLPHTRNIQGAYNIDYLFRLPWALGADVGATWNIASGGNEDAANLKRDNGYGTLNLRAGLVSTKGFLINAFVKNALDRRYEQASIGSNNDGYLQYWSSPMSVGISLTLLQ